MCLSLSCLLPCTVTCSVVAISAALLEETLLQQGSCSSSAGGGGGGRRDDEGTPVLITHGDQDSIVQRGRVDRYVQDPGLLADGRVGNVGALAAVSCLFDLPKHVWQRYC